MLTHFVREITPDRWIFISFVSLAKKHHTLALFSTVRLHKVQAMMNLRQTLEAGASAAFAIANPDYSHFVTADEHGFLDPVPPKQRYAWLDRHYPAGSAAIKDAKEQINTIEAHANLIITQRTCRNDIEDRSFETPFFDIEDEHYVKTDLCRIADVALVLMQFFAEVNEGRNVVKFAEDFWPLITAFRQTNDALRDELMSSDRFKRVIAIQELRQASTKKA
jgi:hypothetical protein